MNKQTNEQTLAPKRGSWVPPTPDLGNLDLGVKLVQWVFEGSPTSPWVRGPVGARPSGREGRIMQVMLGRGQNLRCSCFPLLGSDRHTPAPTHTPCL